MEKKFKNYLKLGALLLGISVAITSCQKDDELKVEEQQSHHSDTLSRIQLKTGDNVSKEVVDYLKAKSGNTLKVTFFKGGVKLSDGGMNARETALGTIDTEKEIVVENETNTKHTFNVITVSSTTNSITNLIVVETETSIYEYFMVYTFEGVLPYDNESKTILLSQFTGTITTYDDGGVLTGIISLESGLVVSNEGQSSIDCSEEEDTSDTTDSTDNTSGSGSTSGIDTGTDGTPTGETPTGDGGGWIANVDGGCGISLINVCSNGKYGNHVATQWCGGTYDGNGIMIFKDCYGNVVASGRDSSTSKSSVTDPCAGAIGVLLDFENFVENFLEDGLLDCWNNTLTAEQRAETVAFLTANAWSGNAVEFSNLAVGATCNGGDVDFEEQIIYDLDTKCQEKLVKEAVEISHPLVQSIKEVFQKDDKFKLKFISKDLDGVSGPIDVSNFKPAGTVPLANCNDNGECVITIELDSDMLAQSTDLFIKAQVIHEMVHAALIYMYETGILVPQNPYIGNSDVLFEAFAAYQENQSIATTGAINTTQHDFMVLLANSLENALKTYQSSFDQETINNIPSTIYKDITWGGSLKGTNAFGLEYPTQTEKDRLNFTNIAEIKNGQREYTDQTTTPPTVIQVNPIGTQAHWFSDIPGQDCLD